MDKVRRSLKTAAKKNPGVEKSHPRDERRKARRAGESRSAGEESGLMLKIAVIFDKKSVMAWSFHNKFRLQINPRVGNKNVLVANSRPFVC